MRVRMNRVYDMVGGVDLMLSEAICQASVYESFLNSHVLVNCNVLVKQEQELHQS